MSNNLLCFQLRERHWGRGERIDLNLITWFLHTPMYLIISFSNILTIQIFCAIRELIILMSGSKYNPRVLNQVLLWRRLLLPLYLLPFDWVKIGSAFTSSFVANKIILTFLSFTTNRTSITIIGTKLVTVSVSVTKKFQNWRILLECLNYMSYVRYFKWVTWQE